MVSSSQSSIENNHVIIKKEKKWSNYHHPVWLMRCCRPLATTSRVSPSNFPNNPCGNCFCISEFADEKTEALRRQTACPGPHGRAHTPPQACLALRLVLHLCSRPCSSAVLGVNGITIHMGLQPFGVAFPAQLLNSKTRDWRLSFVPAHTRTGLCPLITWQHWFMTCSLHLWSISCMSTFPIWHIFELFILCWALYKRQCIWHSNSPFSLLFPLSPSLPTAHASSSLKVINGGSIPHSRERCLVKNPTPSLKSLRLFQHMGSTCDHFPCLLPPHTVVSSPWDPIFLSLKCPSEILLGSCFQPIL